MLLPPQGWLLFDEHLPIEDAPKCVLTVVNKIYADWGYVVHVNLTYKPLYKIMIYFTAVEMSHVFSTVIVFYNCNHRFIRHLIHGKRLTSVLQASLIIMIAIVIVTTNSVREQERTSRSKRRKQRLRKRRIFRVINKDREWQPWVLLPYDFSVYSSNNHQHQPTYATFTPEVARPTHQHANTTSHSEVDWTPNILRHSTCGFSAMIRQTTHTTSPSYII